VSGYRYQLIADGPIDDQGRQCYRFRVDNVLLANTLPDTRDGGTGRGAGYNDLYLTAAFVPGDDPVARTRVKGFRFTSARYPVGGIRSPVDGVIRVEAEDWVEQCGPTVSGP
jgi:hypothetical protein